MGRKFHLSIPGPPVGKGRPRFDRKSGAVFTPGDTRREEQRISGIWNKKYGREQPLTGPVMVRFTAVFAIPKGFTAIQRQAALEGRLYATKAPDKENIEKLIWDALNGLAWVDDAQCMGGGIKRYGEPERVDVTIEELETVETPGDIRRKTRQKQNKFRF